MYGWKPNEDESGASAIYINYWYGGNYHYKGIENTANIRYRMKAPAMPGRSWSDPYNLGKTTKANPSSDMLWVDLFNVTGENYINHFGGVNFIAYDGHGEWRNRSRLKNMLTNRGNYGF